MRVGFTGTREGLTNAQRQALEIVLVQECGRPGEVHHGDCVGADAQVHVIAREHGYWVAIHPPDQHGLRAFCEGDLILAPLPYLARNHRIVDATDVLVACPAEDRERLRSGTWSTVRYAVRSGKVAVLVLPDGSVRRLLP